MKLTTLFTAFLLGLAGCASQTDSNAIGEPRPSEPAPPRAARPDAPHADLVRTGGSPTHALAAAASLTTLANMVRPDKTMGFQSVAEVASAGLATPLPMYMVGLDPLRAYHAGDDPRPLLVDEGAVMYPVTVGGQVRSSVVVRHENGEWKTTQFGRQNLAKLAHEGRGRIAVARGVTESEMSLVEIPTMSTRMLGHEENGVSMLTALVDVPGTDMRAGSTLPAAEVFAKLQPLAAANDGRFPN